MIGSIDPLKDRHPLSRRQLCAQDVEPRHEILLVRRDCLLDQGGAPTSRRPSAALRNASWGRKCQLCAAASPYRAQDTLTLKECAPASDVQERVPASSLLMTRRG
jgi:hypothetical protein